MLPNKQTEIVVLSPASGAPEPLQPAANGGGRGQKAEFNPINRDVIERITVWAMTPELYRFPPTAKELATELGISPSWVCKIKKRIPDNMPEFLNMAEDEALSNHRDVVRMITAQAVQGNNKAQAIYMKHIAANRKQAPQTNFQFKSDVVNFGINLVMGKTQQMQSVPKTIESNAINQLGEQQNDDMAVDNRAVQGNTEDRATNPRD